MKPLKYLQSKKILILGILSFGLFVLPFLLLSFYSQPYLDDYVMPVYMKELGGWFEWQKNMFSSYSGRYFSTLMYLISPTNYFHPEWYFAVPFLLINFTILVFIQFFRKIFSLNFSHSFVLANLCFGVIFGLSFSVFELLFWTASSLYYWLSFLLLLSLLISLYTLNSSTKTSKFTKFISIFLVVAILGTNEISAIFTVLLLMFYAFVKMNIRKLQLIDTSLLLIAVAILLGLIFFSGNAERIHNFEHNRQLFWSIGRAFEVGIKSLAFQFQSPVFIFSSIGLLLISKQLIQKFRSLELFQNIKAYWVLALGVFSVFISYFVSYYLLGNNPAWRIHAIIQANFMLVWAFFLLILSKKMNDILEKLNQISILKYLLILFIFWFSLTDFNYKQQESRPISIRNNIAKVWYELIFDAPKFSQENKIRKEKEEKAIAENNLNVVFTKYSNPPESLFFEDLSEDSTARYNVFYARYFGLKSVKIQNK